MTRKFRFFFILFCFLFSATYAQNVIYLNNCETTGGNWGVIFSSPNTSYVTGNSSFFDTPSNSPFFSSFNTSIMHQGLGNAGSGPERVLITLPAVSINPNVASCFKMKFASIGLNPSINSGAGVDNQDYLRLSVSYNGGNIYSPEIQVNGGNNNTWPFNTSNSIYRTAQGSLSNYAQVIGNEYSSIVLELPIGTSQVAFEIDLSLNAAGETWLIDDMELVGSCYSPLPVSLLYFDSFLEENKAIVKWATITESNNDYFQVFSSNDLQQITLVKTVDGSGNSNLQKSYMIVDSYPSIFYMLCQTDYDGQKKCYDWIVTKNRKTSKEKYRIYDLFGREISTLKSGFLFFVDEYGKAKKIIIY